MVRVIFEAEVRFKPYGRRKWINNIGFNQHHYLEDGSIATLYRSTVQVRPNASDSDLKVNEEDRVTYLDERQAELHDHALALKDFIVIRVIRVGGDTTEPVEEEDVPPPPNDKEEDLINQFKKLSTTGKMQALGLK